MSHPPYRKGTRVTVIRDGVPVPSKMQSFSGGWIVDIRGRNVRDTTKHTGFEDGTLGGFYSFDDEGVTWIRGHRAPDDVTVKAMLGAFALGSTRGVA